MDARVSGVEAGKGANGMTLTETQRRAVEATGSVLVAAGAGAGKTRTLVERCVRMVLDPEQLVGLDEILMVTFTESAAAEMKERIRSRLMQERGQNGGAGSGRVEEQLALLDSSRIGTLHGFCLQLVREHSHALGIDPQPLVLVDEQRDVLMEETLDEILGGHYAGGTELGPAVQELIRTQANGRDSIVRDLVVKLHHYTQTLPEPERWFREQQELVRGDTPRLWREWLARGFAEWRDLWVPELKNHPSDNERAHACADLLEQAAGAVSRDRIAALLEKILALEASRSNGTKGNFHPPTKELFSDAAFLKSVAAVRDAIDPLTEDWGWVRPQLATILSLAQEFGQGFAAAKRDLGALDFHDFEQFALRLLWDSSTHRPSALAEQLRHQFKQVFVDEYQDINAAQDRIIEAVSREGAAANRFLVGDIKQSIYRFRLSDPGIFQGYRRKWAAAGATGTVIPLAENFRSREMLLRFINPVFTELLREEIGGVACAPEDELKFGSSDRPEPVAGGASAEARVEVLLRLTGVETDSGEGEGEGEDGNEAVVELAEAGNTEMEARMIARRLKALMAEPHQVWDEDERTFRPARWSDVAILQRSVRNKAESFAKEFHRESVPLDVERGGFYENTEITDLLSLLQVLDNPLQDVPLLAVLHSPLVGLSAGDLAEIRLAGRHDPFWTVLLRWHDHHRRALGELKSTWTKIDRFLERHARWRRMARETALSVRIEAVLDETNYGDRILAGPRGRQRAGNIRHLIFQARQFDPLQRQGLQRFLRYIEARKESETDGEPALASDEDAVRLMSIHKSKGLEFPVVVLAGLGTRFNLRDLSDHVILDEKFGLCPRIRPPQSMQHYPSLPAWLAGKRQRREALGEELRLLYVAMTRARDTLILAGTTKAEVATKTWPGLSTNQATNRQLLKARSYLDWLGPLLVRLGGEPDHDANVDRKGRLLRWNIVGDEELKRERRASDSEQQRDASDNQAPDEADPATMDRLKGRIEWRYPHECATREPAKTSVSRLRRRLDENIGESRVLFQAMPFGGRRSRIKNGATREMSASDMGTAHHLFLEQVDLEQTGTDTALKAEAERMLEAGELTAQEVASLDLAGLKAFWDSELGQKIREQRRHVHREIPFTARLSPADLENVGLSACAGLDPQEYFVLQGVVDLAVILPREIEIVDFKTDHFSPGELDGKVRIHTPQLKLYATVLERIYRRPVTARHLCFLALGRFVEV
jgi:ATP-dependent helicase/nuclease subunit A